MVRECGCYSEGENVNGAEKPLSMARGPITAGKNRETNTKGKKQSYFRYSKWVE